MHICGQPGSDPTDLANNSWERMSMMFSTDYLSMTEDKNRLEPNLMQYMGQLRFIADLQAHETLSELEQVISCVVPAGDTWSCGHVELTVDTIRAAESLRAAVAMFFAAAVPLAEGGAAAGATAAFVEASNAVYSASVGELQSICPGHIYIICLYIIYRQDNIYIQYAYILETGAYIMSLSI